MPTAQDYIFTATRRYQKFLDDSTPHVKERWLGTLILAFLYVFRTLYLHQFYVVMYATGIYLLNLLLAFLTPKFDPALDDDNMLDNDEEDEPLGPKTGAMGMDSLPKTADDEFKPFIRRLPEFKFWFWTTRAFLIAFFCTFVPFLDIPVFWPILLLYFVLLFALTMRRQIKHMIKYRYIPFDIGKKSYKKSGPRVSQAAAQIATSLMGMKQGDSSQAYGQTTASGVSRPPVAAASGATAVRSPPYSTSSSSANSGSSSLGGAYSLMTSSYSMSPQNAPPHVPADSTAGSSRSSAQQVPHSGPSHGSSLPTALQEPIISQTRRVSPPSSHPGYPRQPSQPLQQQQSLSRPQAVQGTVNPAPATLKNAP